MSSQSEYLSQLNQHINQEWQAAQKEWKNMGKLTDLVDLGARYLNGGKRTRARLADLGYQIALASSATTKNQVSQTHDLSTITLPSLKLGVAIEFYQASALIHDDLIDRAELRRGFPCLHHQFSDLHKQQNLVGDSQHFGISAAILLGDLLLATAQQQAVQAFNIAQLSTTEKTLGINTFFQMTKEVAIGQYFDLYLEHNPQATITQIKETVTLKSARYSVARPLQLGSQLGAGQIELQEELFTLGQTWGMAFQLRDDYLGVLGNHLKTGKQAGEDLKEGKRTHLWNLVINSNDEELKTNWSNVFANHNSSLEAITKTQDSLENSTVIVEHEKLIRSYYQAGCKIVEQSTLIPPDFKEKLNILGSELVYRHH